MVDNGIVPAQLLTWERSESYLRQGENDQNRVMKEVREATLNK